MRFLRVTAVIALLSLTACSSQVIVAKSGRHPAPPHPVRGPVASLRIPPGHYPPPGHCRVWFPGRPPGHQPRPVRCNSLGDVPLGAWVLHRPMNDKKIVEVTAYHEAKPKIVVSVSHYDAKTGTLIRARVAN